MEEEARFHWADYLIFALTLAISTGVGIYFGCTGKKQKTTEDFLMAGRNMAVLPVSISLFVSWLSAISFLGDPVEVYVHGAIYWFLGLGYILALPFIAEIFAPTFQKMNLISAYEFLGEKFHGSIRLACSLSSTIVIFGWLGIVLYAPALALSQVSGMPVWVAITSISCVCTFYTTLGGMKAVLWADTLQCLIMVVGQLAVVIQGCARVGGIGRVWEIAEQGGRLNFWSEFDPSPLVRTSFWAFLVGGFFRVHNPYMYTQMCIQRYCTLSTPRKARLAVYLNIPMFVLLVSLFALIGLVMYAMYHDCDPLLAGRIERRDQMVPLLVLELLGEFPGVPGLFMACVFSASLSSMSSGFNSIAATTLRDIVMPLYKHHTGKVLSDDRSTLVAKILAASFGILNMAAAFLVLNLGSSIFEMCTKVVGIIGSPMAGVMVCAIVFPAIDVLSVSIGFIISFSICIWWGLGAFFVPPKVNILPVDASCISLDAFLANSTVTSPTETIYSSTSYYSNDSFSGIQSHTDSSSFQVQDLYYWNPLLYGPLGTMTTITIALIIHYSRVLIRKCNGNDDKHSAGKHDEEKFEYYKPTTITGDLSYNEISKLNESAI